MPEVFIAVIGGLIVLGVQAIAVLLWQWRKKVREGELPASRTYVRARRLGLIGRKRRTRARLRQAASQQRSAIESQYAKDPLWNLGQLRLLLTTGGGEKSVPTPQSLDAALASATTRGRGLLVRGEPGAGKSSAAALAAYAWPQGQLALRYDLATYAAHDDLLTEVAQEFLATGDVEAGLALGEVILVFDGFESLDDAARQTFDRQLQQTVLKYPDVRFAVMTRPETQPTKTLLRCIEARILELTSDDIDEAIRAFGKDAAHVLSSMDERILNLCTSPLALRMVLQSMDEAGSVSEKPATLYARFVEALLRETVNPSDSTVVSAESKRQLLGVLATYCDNRLTSVDFATAQRILTPAIVELQSLYQLPANLEAIEAIRQLVADGILRSDGRTLKFVHYSVQEFLAADALRLSMLKGDTRVSDVINLAAEREWHNSLVYLSGVLPDATELVEALGARNRILSAECAQSASYVDPHLVDRFIVEALYEFKFGKMSFNYEQVFSLLRIAELRSPDLPQRIISEMQYWCAKYAERAHNELRDIDNAALIGILAAGGSGTREQDAAWTLGVRGAQDAVPVLEALLRARCSPMDRVAALALGKLRSRSSASLLLSTALDEEAPEGLRSTCFNSVGEARAKECLPAVLDYIRSGGGLDGSVRENAAWSLIGLMDPLLAQDSSFQELLVEQVKVGRPYARAMFAYLIGQFEAYAAVPTLIELCESGTEEPLVLEDISFALGTLGQSAANRAIEGLLTHEDNIVRARAIEAAVRLPEFDRKILLPFASDDEASDIVQATARSLLDLNKLGERKVSGVTLSPDLRRRR